MNTFSIAYKNYKSNLKVYRLHLAAMIFSVIAYYNFVSLKHNPEVLKAQVNTREIAGTANVTQIVLLLFLVFFIWYSTSFFLNQRKKEIGIYTFMGVQKSKIGAIFAIESLFLGLTSIIVGLALGVLLGKLFLMMLAKVALLNVQVDFFVSSGGLIETSITFFIVFFLTSLQGYISIVRSKLIDLFNASKKEEQIPKVSYVKGVLSIAILGLGYYVSIKALILGFFTGILITLILVVWGTYWLFGSFFTIVARYLTNRKSLLYKGTNLVSISNQIFKIRKNYRTLATIAVLIATTITAFGTVSSLKYFVNKNYETEVPYTFSYVAESEDIDNSIKTVIDNSNHNLELWKKSKILFVDKFSTNYNLYNRSFAVMSLTDFKEIVKDLDPESYEKNYSDITLDDSQEVSQVIYVESPGVMMSILKKYDGTININDSDFQIKEQIKTPLLGGGVPSSVLIVSDKDYTKLSESFKEYYFDGIIVDNDENTEKLINSIREAIPKNVGLYSKMQAHKGKYDIFGVVYFLGAFMSLVFIVATGSIIYFKLISDALDDKEKYVMLRKIGMTQKEITHSISQQVGISFLIPLIIGSIHSIFAIRVLMDLMNYDLTIPTVISIAAFTVIYGVFCFGTIRKSLSIIGVK